VSGRAGQSKKVPQGCGKALKETRKHLGPHDARKIDERLAASRGVFAWLSGGTGRGEPKEKGKKGTGWGDQRGNRKRARGTVLVGSYEKTSDWGGRCIPLRKGKGTLRVPYSSRKVGGERGGGET